MHAISLRESCNFIIQTRLVEQKKTKFPFDFQTCKDYVESAFVVVEHSFCPNFFLFQKYLPHEIENHYNAIIQSSALGLCPKLNLSH